MISHALAVFHIKSTVSNELHVRWRKHFSSGSQTDVTFLRKIEILHDVWWKPWSRQTLGNINTTTRNMAYHPLRKMLRLSGWAFVPIRRQLIDSLSSSKSIGCRANTSHSICWSTVTSMPFVRLSIVWRHYVENNFGQNYSQTFISLFFFNKNPETGCINK